jgi:hypothetical protein
MSQAALRRVYASLPYEFRRQIFRLRRPEIYGSWQAMRVGENPDGYSFAPFDRYRCIFIHVPKCAGVSVSKSLFGGLAGGHRSIGRYQMIFRKREFDSYFKFAFVRNPWDRLLSAFLYLKGGGFNEVDRKWAEENLAAYSDFDSFVRRWVTPRKIWSWVHFIPQTYFIGIDGAPALDFIGHYENLAADFRFVATKLGIEGRLTPANQNRSAARDFRTFYTEETSDIVADVYRDDIKALGYCFDRSTVP